MNQLVIEKLGLAGDGKLCPTIILHKNGNILKGLRHYTPDKWKTISVWTNPGGRSDLGETLEESLRREVREEVDIKDFTITDFIGEFSGAKEGDILLVFYGETAQDPKLMEPEKFSEWKWVSIDEYIMGAPYNVMNPVAHTAISNYLKGRA